MTLPILFSSSRVAKQVFVFCNSFRFLSFLILLCLFLKYNSPLNPTLHLEASSHPLLPHYIVYWLSFAELNKNSIMICDGWCHALESNSKCAFAKGGATGRFTPSQQDRVSKQKGNKGARRSRQSWGDHAPITAMGKMTHVRENSLITNQN